jgi:hypothetical protein
LCKRVKLATAAVLLRRLTHSQTPVKTATLLLIAPGTNVAVCASGEKAGPFYCNSKIGTFRIVHPSGTFEGETEKMRSKFLMALVLALTLVTGGVLASGSSTRTPQNDNMSANTNNAGGSMTGRRHRKRRRHHKRRRRHRKNANANTTTGNSNR